MVNLGDGPKDDSLVGELRTEVLKNDMDFRFDTQFCFDTHTPADSLVVTPNTRQLYTHHAKHRCLHSLCKNYCNPKSRSTVGIPMTKQ